MGAFPLAAGSVRKRNVDRGAGWRSAIPSVQICWLLRIRVVGTAEFELEPAVGFGGNDHLSEEAFVILLREVLAEMAVPEPAFLPVQGRVHGAASDGEQVVDFVEPEEIVEILGAEAKEIQAEDQRMCRAISEYGLSLIKDGDGILTHCNAGPLATSSYGTALGPLFLGKERGMNFHVFSDETRPLLQGARLTSYELQKAGIDVTLICDNMASIVMKNGWIQACFVGCDRVAANGDAANKIGTSGVAILARYYGIPFYVLGPTSTIDMNCKTGADIKIELRNPDEIKKKFYEKPMALEEVKCYNPAFDVTDHELIAGIITEKGICRAPYTESLAKLFED